MHVVLFIVLYFLPVFIALMRRHQNAMPIFILNTLLGWTVLVWLWCLVWSTTCNVQARMHGP